MRKPKTVIPSWMRNPISEALERTALGAEGNPYGAALRDVLDRTRIYDIGDSNREQSERMEWYRRSEDAGLGLCGSEVSFLRAKVKQLEERLEVKP